jgi:demethylmenaquinone methyltransferase/2-methoxy-6-polyprenyl-1,4-benzoquinol methylase
MSQPQFEFTSSEEKKSYVRTMFSDIAGRYDFLNHFLSFGLDYYWRHKAVSIIKNHVAKITEPHVLDIACGTGDLSFELLKYIPNAKITGIDLAKPMLDIFQQKINARKSPITIDEGDVEALTFADNTFDAVTIGFATRNFSKLDIAFKEIARVLKPCGIFVNLELSKPRRTPMRLLYAFYSKRILPIIGKMISKNTEAYTYLPDSIQRFPEREEIMKMLHEAGFSQSEWHDLSAGIVTMHVGKK